MALTTLFEQAATAQSTDGQTAWLDSSTVTTLDLEVDVTVLSAVGQANATYATGAPTGEPVAEGADPAPGVNEGTVATGHLTEDEGTEGYGSKGGFASLHLYLEGEEADSTIVLLWDYAYDSAGTLSRASLGPGTDHPTAIPGHVRLRWELSGGAATFSASLTGH